MEQYDKDKDEYLTEEDFIDFYTDACKERLTVVWKNLQVYHYTNNLKKVDEVEMEKIDETLLPRFILKNHEKFFDFMFILLEEDKEIAQEVWKMLNRLPAS
jgi:ubiquitin carboxyl-terminal hydrolase 34